MRRTECSTKTTADGVHSGRKEVEATLLLYTAVDKKSQQLSSEKQKRLVDERHHGIEEQSMYIYIYNIS